MSVCPCCQDGASRLGVVELKAKSNNLERKYDQDKLQKANEVCVEVFYCANLPQLLLAEHYPMDGREDMP